MSECGHNRTFTIGLTFHERKPPHRAPCCRALGCVRLGPIQPSQGAAHQLLVELLSMRRGTGPHAVRGYPGGRRPGSSHFGTGVPKMCETRRAHLVGWHGAYLHPLYSDRRPLGVVRTPLSRASGVRAGASAKPASCLLEPLPIRQNAARTGPSPASQNLRGS